jgi:hypothetical protein
MSGEYVHETVKPSTKVNSLNIGGKTHDIFNTNGQTLESPRKESSRPTSNIFKEDEPIRPTTKLNSLYVGGKSHDIFNTTEESEDTQRKISSPVKPSNIFSQESVPIRPSTRVNSAHIGGKSHDIFTPDLNPVRPAIAPDSHRYETHFTSMGVASDPLSEEVKFGKKMEPNSNASHFTIANGPLENASSEIPLVKKEHNVNESHILMTDTALATEESIKTYNSAYHNQSQINFAGNEDQLPPPSPTKKVNSNASQWNFSDSGPVHVRPSSR